MAHTFVVPIVVSGEGTPASLSGVRFNSFHTHNGWLQNNIQNMSNGNSASSDWIATADTGDDSSGFVDLGINGSGYSSATWTVNGALDAYLYTATSGLAIGTAAANKKVVIFTGGTLAENIRVEVSDAGITCKLPITVNGGCGVQLLTGAPVTTADALYSVNGVLHWDGMPLGQHLHELITPSFSTNLTLSPTDTVGNIRVILTGSTTITMATTGFDGQKVTLELVQDAVGGRTVNLGSGFAWGSDLASYTSPTLTPNKTDIIGLMFHAPSSAWRVVAIARGY